jgi:cellulose biosynthesis protein BcsQ
MSPQPRPVSEKSTLIGFYGFKGGLGRTLAAVHIAHYYSRMGKRVLLVDADLEAPGLSFWNPPRPGESEEGLVQLLAKLESGEDRDGFTLAPYIRNSEDFFRWEIDNHPRAMADCAPVHLLPTGLGPSPDSLDRYIKGLARAEEVLLDRAKTLRRLLQASDYDIVIVDSRAGLHKIAAAIFGDLAEFLVLLTGPSRQAARGFRTALEMFSEDQLSRSVYAMSPVPWQAGEQLELARTALQDRLGALSELPPRVVPIRWHPLLTLDEHLIAIADPSSEIAHDYQSLFVELETVRGFGVDRYTESVDALLNLLKVALDVDASNTKMLNELHFTHKGEEIDEFRLAFTGATEAEYAALQRYLEHSSDSWQEWTARSGLASLLVWEIVRRLRELALLDRDAALALWAIVVRRNQVGRYSKSWPDPADRAGLVSILGRLYSEYTKEFGYGLSGLDDETHHPQSLIPEIGLRGFATAAGGLA